MKWNSHEVSQGNQLNGMRGRRSRFGREAKVRFLVGELSLI